MDEVIVVKFDYWMMRMKAIKVETVDERNRHTNRTNQLSNSISIVRGSSASRAADITVELGIQKLKRFPTCEVKANDVS